MRKRLFPLRTGDGERSSVRHGWGYVPNSAAEAKTKPDADPYAFTPFESVCCVFVAAAALGLVFLYGWMLGEGFVHRQAIERGFMRRTEHGVEWR